MKTKLNNELISAIRSHTPLGTNITSFLEDILLIGRESIYRRLRGEINFTFEEIALIALSLNISIDNIIGTQNPRNTLFDIHLLPDSDFMNVYKERLVNYIELIKKMGKTNKSNIRMAFNSIPYFFSLRHKTLSKFLLYQWAFQTQKNYSNLSLSDFLVPEEVSRIQNMYMKEVQHVHSISVIIDYNMFNPIVQDLAYFHMRKLISDKELQELSDELLEMINLLETTATSGINSLGTEVLMYLSAVAIDSSYAHFEYDGKEVCQIWLYSINGIESQSPVVCEIHKNWIDSLKKHSILISQSGEMQRFEYFEKQRHRINNLINDAKIR